MPRLSTKPPNFTLTMHHISTETLTILALSFLSGVGPATLRRVARLPATDRASPERIAEGAPSVAKALKNPTAWDHAMAAARNQVRLAEKYHARILSPVDEEYPTLLAATKDDPALLYVRGKLISDPTSSVAVIGSREPTAHGEITATRISTFLAKEGFSIVSGLAIGCDGLAHRASLGASGHTVAVMACGLQMVTPSRHRQLAEDIVAKGGALVSQFPFTTGVAPQQYVIRDRVQAGLSNLVVMVQSDLKGGSLHASRASLEYGRTLAVPYPTDTDIANDEPKAQANLLIIDGDDSARAAFLRCKPEELANVIVIRGRDDYTKLAAAIRATGIR